MILFDDYDCFRASHERGQRRALREFLAREPDIRSEPVRTHLGYGKTFRINMESERRNDASGRRYGKLAARSESRLWR
jgi:hypothetical protein